MTVATTIGGPSAAPLATLSPAARRRELAAVRRYAIAQMWRDGATQREIADAIGVTINGIGTDLNRLRALCVLLPPRRPDLIGPRR